MEQAEICFPMSETESPRSTTEAAGAARRRREGPNGLTSGDASQSIKERLARAVGFVPAQDWLVVGWVLAIKALIFVLGIKSYQILENKRFSGIHPWLEIWNRWDAPHYLQVAQTGYQAKDVLVYPLFPWCVRLVAFLGGDYLVAALIVAGAALIAAAVLLRRLVELDYPADVAQRGVWFFLIFPTAYFLHVGYTESLFLGLALGCLLAARTERWWLAGALGALSTMTRATGLVLIPTLVVELIHQFVATKRWQWRWLWIAVVPAGYGVYLFINWHFAGGVFAFLHTRKQFFYTSPSWPWTGISHAIGDLHRAPGQAEMVGAQELYFITLGLVCAIVSWIKLRPLYAMWITMNWLGATSLTFVQSAPRYSLTMFPIFILFALLAANRFWNAVITVWSLLFLALFTAVFVRGWWAF